MPRLKGRKGLRDARDDARVMAEGEAAASGHAARISQLRKDEVAIFVPRGRMACSGGGCHFALRLAGRLRVAR